MNKSRQKYTAFETHVMPYNESYSQGIMGARPDLYRNGPTDERKLRNITEYMRGSMPKDDPANLPKNQRTILQQLSNQKLENLNEHKMRYDNLATGVQTNIPRPSVANRQYYHIDRKLYNSPATARSEYNYPYADYYTTPVVFNQTPGSVTWTDGNSTSSATSGAKSDLTNIQRLVELVNKDHFQGRQPERKQTTVLLSRSNGRQNEVEINPIYSSAVPNEPRLNPRNRKPLGKIPVSIGGAPMTDFKNLGFELQKREVNLNSKRSERGSNSLEVDESKNQGNTDSSEQRHLLKRNKKKLITVAVLTRIKQNPSGDGKAQQTSSANPDPQRGPDPVYMYSDLPKSIETDPTSNGPPATDFSGSESLQ